MKLLRSRANSVVEVPASTLAFSIQPLAFLNKTISSHIKVEAKDLNRFANIWTACRANFSIQPLAQPSTHQLSTLRPEGARKVYRRSWKVTPEPSINP